MYSFTVLLEVWIKILAEMISAESSQLIDDGLHPTPIHVFLSDHLCFQL